MTDDLVKRLRWEQSGAEFSNRYADLVGEAADRIEALTADKIAMQDQIGKLLSKIDDYDKVIADEYNGGLTMHTYGMTPDWYVKAAFWSCYGVSPNDPKAKLEGKP